MTPAKLNLPLEPNKFFYRNDTIPAITITIKDKVTLVPIDLTGASIKMQWRTKDNRLLKTFQTSDNTITISSPPSNGVFVIPQFICDVESGLHDYDIQITIGALVETYLYGNVTVREDITK